MKVALIGASGFVGKAILHELLQRAHEVTAVVRNPQKINPAASLNIVVADVYNEGELSKAIAGHDAVISAFNAGWTNPNLYNDFLKGSEAIQKAIQEAGIPRLLVVGGAGSLFIAPGQQIVDTEGFPEDWKAGALAARDYLNILKKDTTLDWTFLSPAIEMNPSTSGIRKGIYRKGLESPVFDKEGRSVISVEDIAVAIVDELEDPKHIRQRFTVGY